MNEKFVVNLTSADQVFEPKLFSGVIFGLNPISFNPEVQVRKYFLMHVLGKVKILKY